VAKIALVGASGTIGRQILDEALARGHQVTAIVRNPERLPPQSGVDVVQADIADISRMAASVRNADALIISIRWNDNAADVLRVARASGVQRMVAVVGAGSLDARPGVRVIDAPEFPPEWRPGAESAVRALATLRGEAELDWLAISPSWRVVAGERTGKFRVGADQLLRDARGDSLISIEDLAVAILNEVEQPRHHRQRITVGY
jgi:hypothetical protein